MPAKKKLNKLATKFNKRKTETIEVEHSGGGGFPDKIENGVAEIKSMKIGVFENGANKGKPYFMVRGVAVLPKALDDGTPVEGCQDTLEMVSLFDTPDRKRKTEDENLDYMIGLLQEIGLDTSDIDWDGLEDGSIFAALLEDPIYVRFRTWKPKPTNQYPNPRVNVTYGGPIHDFVPPDDEDPVDIADDPADERELEPEEPVEVEPASGEVDWDALAELADTDDDDDETVSAQEQITKYASENGIEAEDYDSWAEVIEAINGSGEDEADLVVPEKEEVYQYIPKGSKEAIEVEVVTVNKTKKLCKLKNLDTGKTYQNVPWDQLEE